MSDEDRDEARATNSGRPKVAVTDVSMPCLTCEQPVMLGQHERDEGKTVADIVASNFDFGVHCSTGGNYGSQVLDMDGMLHFVLCDRCVIRHSAKMLHEPRTLRPPFSPHLMVEGLKPDPLENARDHYEKWLTQLWRPAEDEFADDGSRAVNDDYLKTISEHFKD